MANQIAISYSDDGGHTWSAEQHYSTGEEGDYLIRVILHSQGHSVQRQYRIMHTGDEGFTLISAHADIEIGI